MDHVFYFDVKILSLFRVSWEYPLLEDSYASLQSHLLLVYIKFTKLFKGFGFLCLAPTQLEALKSFLIWFG